MPDESHACETYRSEIPPQGELLFRNLRFAEQFTVWALRKWVASMRSGTKSLDELNRAFLEARMGDEFAPFDHLMRLVAASAKRTIDVRCVGCRLVSPDEAMALAMFEAQQRGEAVSAHMYLDDWVPPAAARIAFHSVGYVAEAMDRGGIRLAGNRERHAVRRFARAVH